MNNTKKGKNPRGRPRTYEREVVLDAAMQVFCCYGYDATSLKQLTRVMKMTPPSLYAAFGDKEHLFVEVLEYYHALYRHRLQEIFAQNETKKAFQGLFELAEMMHARSTNTGCLIVNSGINSGTGNKAITKKIQQLHELNEKMIYDRLKLGQEHGHIVEGTNIRALARYINGLMQGAAVLARGQQASAVVSDMLQEAWATLGRIIL